MEFSPIASWQIDGETMEAVTDFIFLWAPKSLQMVMAALKLNDAYSLEEKFWQTRQHIEKWRHYLADKGLSSQSYDFSSSHVWMWELDHEESWVLKNWCFWTVVLKKTPESPLDCKEIKPVNPKGDQSWIFIGRTDAEAEASILWPPHEKSQLTRKGPDAGKDWRQEEKGMIEDEMVGWHHWFNVHEFDVVTWWRKGKPGMLQSMGLQRVGHDWATTNTLHSLWATTNTLHSLKYLLNLISEITYHKVYIQSWT